MQFTGNTDYPSSLLEELHWTLLISGHVLADPGDGETPMVSKSLIVCSVFNCTIYIL